MLYLRLSLDLKPIMFVIRVKLCICITCGMSTSFERVCAVPINVIHQQPTSIGQIIVWYTHIKLHKLTLIAVDIELNNYYPSTGYLLRCISRCILFELNRICVWLADVYEVTTVNSLGESQVLGSESSAISKLKLTAREVISS